MKDYVVTVRIGYDKSNTLRYIESGSGETYECYGVATNDAAARKMAAEVRKRIAEEMSSRNVSRTLRDGT